jgi:hypothetical protein
MTGGRERIRSLRKNAPQGGAICYEIVPNEKLKL